MLFQACRSERTGQVENLHVISERDLIMFHWAIVFFIIAIIAAIFGFSGLAHDTANIAKILAVIGLIFAILSFAFHRRSSRD